MLEEEATWLGSRLASLPDAELFPFLNVGSSTGAFRAVTQPHIDREIFQPLQARGGTVYHVDMKRAPGVDFAGDILDADFRAVISERVAARCVMISNLLEHVRDRVAVAAGVSDFVAPGGLLIVSGPRTYPYHPDPIDTRFRPSVEEVHALFPDTELIDGEIVMSPTWRPWSSLGQGRRGAALYVGRLALPIYRPRAWRRRMDSAPYVFRRASAYAVVLKKEDDR
jgi:hypothetical protein